MNERKCQGIVEATEAQVRQMGISGICPVKNQSSFRDQWFETLTFDKIGHTDLPPFYVKLSDEQVGHLLLARQKGMFFQPGHKLAQWWPEDFDSHGCILTTRKHLGKPFVLPRKMSLQSRVLAGANLVGTQDSAPNIETNRIAKIPLSSAYKVCKKYRKSTIPQSNSKLPLQEGQTNRLRTISADNLAAAGLDASDKQVGHVLPTRKRKEFKLPKKKFAESWTEDTNHISHSIRQRSPSSRALTCPNNHSIHRGCLEGHHRLQGESHTSKSEALDPASKAEEESGVIHVNKTHDDGLGVPISIPLVVRLRSSDESMELMTVNANQNEEFLEVKPAHTATGKEDSGETIVRWPSVRQEPQDEESAEHRSRRTHQNSQFPLWSELKQELVKNRFKHAPTKKELTFMMTSVLQARVQTIGV